MRCETSRSIRFSTSTRSSCIGMETNDGQTWDHRAMEMSELLVDLFGRVGETVDGAVHGLDAETLSIPPAIGTNSIGWLVWHLTRVQDHHVSELLEEDQLWVQGTWAKRFGVSADPDNTGYGHTPAEVEQI